MSRTVTLEKVYKKLQNVESTLMEMKYGHIRTEKISRKEARLLERRSREIDKGHYISLKKAISILEK